MKISKIHGMLPFSNFVVLLLLTAVPSCKQGSFEKDPGCKKNCRWKKQTGSFKREREREKMQDARCKMQASTQVLE